MSIKRLDKDTADIAYIKKVFIQQDDILSGIIDTVPVGAKHMQLSPIEARILQIIISLSGAKKVVELGVLAGYSTINMAKVIADDGKIYAIDCDERAIKIAQDNAFKANVGNKIEFICKKGLEGLESIKSKAPFDLIFIDADKAGYDAYLDWAEENIKIGGVIVADNTFLFGNVWQDQCPSEVDKKSYDSMRKFNERLGNSAKYRSIIIPTAEGLSLGIRIA